MKVHEYRAKHLFAEAGIPVPQGRAAATPLEARVIAEELHGPVVVKAQVLVGGRGKAGGIQVAKTPEEAQSAAERILSMRIKGLPVEKVLVEQALPVRNEFYLGLIVDRSVEKTVLMASALGGVDIEEVASTHPEAIVKVPIDPLLGLYTFQVRSAGKRLGLREDALTSFVAIARGLYRVFCQSDATLAEINPLAMTDDGRLIALDAKLLIDDNALYRHKELSLLAEEAEEDELEREAHRKGLAYVRLDGEVGIIGNGAGLTMTTLDAVQSEGARPANFLDIGGGARAEVVREGLSLILRDPQVKGVFINIFGGITRCDEVARGILAALEGWELKVPVVVRLTGTREEEGRRLLEGTPLTWVPTMENGARLIARVVKGMEEPFP